MSTIVTALIMTAIGWSFLIGCLTIRMMLVNGKRSCGNIKVRKNDICVLVGALTVCTGLPILYTSFSSLLFISPSATIMLLLGILYVLTFATDLQCKCWYKINKKIKQQRANKQQDIISH